MNRPTLHVTNWSSRKLHGPGRKLTIMVKPRHWERGDGYVWHLTPMSDLFRAVKSGQLDMDEYRQQYVEIIEANLSNLFPGTLWWNAIDQSKLAQVVEDGDTLCCACSRENARNGRCHRVWAAGLLTRVGWRVILDGVEVSRDAV